MLLSDIILWPKRWPSLPLSCAIAAESRELSIEVRQLIVARYRVLFIVEGKNVTILHVRGPFVSEIVSTEEDIE